MLSLRLIEAFAAERRGTVTIFAIIAFAMLIGCIGLVFDVGRVMNIHSQANSYVDRVALAAAAEMDKTSDSLARAVKAANGAGGVNPIVGSGLRFSLSADKAVGVRKLTFMSALGPDPTDPYAKSPVAGDVVVATWTPGGGFVYSAGYTAAQANAAARYVLVDSTLETEDYVFFPIVASVIPGMSTSATVAPQAVAGFNQKVCNYAPIMICNPSEATAGSGADFNPIVGQQTLAKVQGNGAGWGPGIFGLLDAGNTNSASAIREAMANRNPNTICTDAKVDVKTGQATGPVQQGMNVRFDMYSGPMNGNKNNPDYPPAANVTRGLKTPNNCNNTKSNTSMPLPRDTCFVNGTGCTYYGGQPRFGNGSWDRAGYWAKNHGAPAVVHAQPPGYATMTRYQVYRHEIENNKLPNTTDEKGAPSCANPAQNPPSTSVLDDRRVLYVAIVNCVENAGILNGNAKNVPIKAYAKVFLTEPVGLSQWGASNDDIYIEMIGKVDANGPDGVLHEYPVLYR